MAENKNVNKQKTSGLNAPAIGQRIPAGHKVVKQKNGLLKIVPKKK